MEAIPPALDVPAAERPAGDPHALLLAAFFVVGIVLFVAAMGVIRRGGGSVKRAPLHAVSEEEREERRRRALLRFGSNGVGVGGGGDCAVAERKGKETCEREETKSEAFQGEDSNDASVPNRDAETRGGGTHRHRAAAKHASHASSMEVDAAASTTMPAGGSLRDQCASAKGKVDESAAKDNNQTGDPATQPAGTAPNAMEAEPDALVAASSRAEQPTLAEEATDATHAQTNDVARKMDADVDSKKRPKEEEVAMTKKANAEPAVAKKIRAAANEGTVTGTVGDAPAAASSKRRQRPAPPPAQLLCEALATACSARVAVAQGEGSWGGEGWVQRKKRAVGVRTAGSEIVLPLIDRREEGCHQPMSREEEWTRLNSSLQSIVSSSSSTTNPFRSILVPSYDKRGLVATAASWHGKSHGSASRDIIDKVVQMYGMCKDDTTRDGLGCCLSTLSQFAAQALALWLDHDITNSPSLTEQAEEESDDEDLFSEFYGSAAAKASAAAHQNSSAADKSALGEFLELCSRPNATLVLPRRLIGDIMTQSSDRSRLAKGVLQQALDCLLVAAPDRKSSASFDSIAKDLAAIFHLITNSADLAKCLTQKLRQEADASLPNDGKSLEASSTVGTLISIGAYTLPPVGFELSRGRAIGYRFFDALKSCDAFPLGAYSFPVDPSIAKVQDEARAVMKHSRSVVSGIVGHCMKKKGGDGKDAVFRWLSTIVHSNEMHANMIQEQLLDERDDVHALVSSRPFLMGVAFSVLEMCTHHLLQTYEKNGVDSFDHRYLGSAAGARLVSSDERRLVATHDDAAIAGNVLPVTFSGATEFFFITSSLLRVALFPGMRIRNEHSSKYKTVFTQLSQLSRSKDSSDGSNSQLSESSMKIAAGLLGWDTCLDDRDITSMVVDFSILQLRYMADLVSTRRGDIGTIPEWMAKLPARYIAHVASHFQQYLSPVQAENAVCHATVLLGSGMNLSVQVRMELMRISVAFVRASVQREVSRQMRKRGAGRRSRHTGSDDDDEDIIDRRDLDIYTSLDKNDHGVVVFASPVASKRLGPALLQTFVAMEAAEGLDVEMEVNFHKNMVQDEIADLILRLWVHPSGAFRQSIATLDDNALNTFFRSVAASICIESDTVFQTILDIQDILENHSKGFPFDQREKMRLNSSYGRLASFLSGLRRLLLLLTYLSQDDRIAAILGGIADLSTMIMSILDKFTAPDGGTHPHVDFRVALKRATDMAASQTSVSASAKELLDARTFAKTEFGLDVSIIAHMLLALASRWTAAAGKQEGHYCSPLVNALVLHDDFDIDHFRRVCDRLIITANSAPAAGSEAPIYNADGYVDSSLWVRYETPSGIGLEESRRQRKGSAAQDQLTHIAIDGIAGVEQIMLFLDDLEREARQRVALKTSETRSIAPKDLWQNERQLLMERDMPEEGYTRSLESWVVSSDSFGTAHFYSSKAKTSSNVNLGKVLLKDARRCWKDLPAPHPNASVFVCYSEERMDLCKALIVGATGTPYSCGVFLFDVCYPQLYPAAAPMVHFMTTGGGQVRFSPNLYNDGKVCISLLGTTNAWDETQRWNPEQSSLAQVLLSIQSQILDVAEPYYTEGGGHGGLEGTRAGRVGSVRYNNTLRLSTLRHAIVEPLKYPPTGFEDVTRRHFAMNRKRLLVQAKRWTLEAKGTELHGRFVKAYSELVALLSSDKLVRESWEVDGSDEDGSAFGALSPVAEDLDALQHLDRNLYNTFNSELHENEQSNANEQGEDDVDVNEAEELNEAMLARALELSLQER